MALSYDIQLVKEYCGVRCSLKLVKDTETRDARHTTKKTLEKDAYLSGRSPKTFNSSNYKTALIDADLYLTY